MTPAESAAEERKQQQERAERQQQEVVNEIAGLSENDAALMFGKNRNKTKERKYFKELKSELERQRPDWIAQWKNSKDANKTKAYKFLTKVDY